MLYHGLVAMSGVGMLLGGWLLVQRLTALGAVPAPNEDLESAGCTVPGVVQSGAACGGCAACGPTAQLPQHMAPTDELARDGPQGDRFLR